MRKLVGILAAVALLATPAMAALTPSSITPELATLNEHTGQGTVGVYAPGGGLYTDFKIIAEPSDIIRVTFAFHWPYATPVYMGQAQHQFVWDNSEVEVLTMQPAGTFAGGVNNYSTLSATWWQGPSTGTFNVGDVLGTGTPLWANPVAQTISTYFGGVFTGVDLHILQGSVVEPLFYVDLHVKDVITDSFLDVVVGQFAQLFHFTINSTGWWWTGGNIGVPSYGMGIVPEPASLALLGLGLASVSVGAWRRRRR